MKSLHRSFRRRHLASAALAVLAAISTSATIAQQAGPSTSDALTEIIVTAERRPENLQTTAIAATVFGADELTQKGVVQMSDLQTASPSLSITPAGLTAVQGWMRSVNLAAKASGLDS